MAAAIDSGLRWNDGWGVGMAVLGRRDGVLGSGVVSGIAVMAAVAIDSGLRRNDGLGAPE